MVWAAVMELEYLIAPIEIRQDETRSTPGLLTGTLLTYETRARDRAELFTSLALYAGLQTVSTLTLNSMTGKMRALCV